MVAGVTVCILLTAMIITGMVLALAALAFGV
jgi:hypothetical protein